MGGSALTLHLCVMVSHIVRIVLMKLTALNEPRAAATAVTIRPAASLKTSYVMERKTVQMALMKQTVVKSFNCAYNYSLS